MNHVINSFLPSLNIWFVSVPLQCKCLEQDAELLPTENYKRKLHTKNSIGRFHYTTITGYVPKLKQVQVCHYASQVCHMLFP